MAISLINKPAKEPVTLDMVKAHLRITDNESDSYLSTLIFVARQHTENYLNRALITQTWDYYRDDFANSMRIPKGQLQSVTTVKYFDTDGVQQTLAGSPIEYSVDTADDPGYVELAYGQSWPSYRDISNTITIRFVAGYGDSWEDVPEIIRQGVLILISTLDQNRELIGQFQMHPLYMSYEALLYPYRLISI